MKIILLVQLLTLATAFQLQPTHGVFSPRPEFPRKSLVSHVDVGDDNSSGSYNNTCDSVELENKKKRFAPWRNFFQRKDKNPHHDDHNDHHHHNPALHQLDHRSKEKLSIAVSEKATDAVVQTVESKLAERASSRVERTVEKLVEKAAKTSGERTVERAVEQGQWWKFIIARRTSVGERTVERTGERVLERAADHVGERALERTGERLLEATAGKGAERDWGTNNRAAERAGEHIGERAVERTGERLLERAADRAAEHIGERAAEHIGERAVERTGERLLERAADRAAEHIGERAAEHIGERAVERTGERLLERATDRAAEHVGERAAEHIGERAVERTGERLLEQAADRAAERVLEQTSGQGAGRAIERIFGVSSEKLALRLGRGLLITLPVLGGIFALYLLKSDIERLKEEWALRVKTSSALFLGAGIVDGLDSFLHFFIGYALWKHLSHKKLAVAEELSFGCAIVSTLCAVLGEVISLQIQKRREYDNNDPVVPTAE
ncbi:expressed unknown protein [Seminavis robusta]|uniref:Uncharacterized protein n=1 Tax=Seminavis robusta TaxID=568900 RepID=A0A9N8EXZ0_9STRA|nr:expressed unknown protein [Seminavis robusta]|eukprot:Sro2338_g323920.1 n/a (500) ;mRNA; r:7922-9521